MQTRKKIAEILAHEDRFLIAAHIDPDGDAIGSMSAMGHILQRLGKKFRLYSRSGLPDRFSWLNLPAPIAQTLDSFQPNWLIALDCGNAQRLGPELTDIMSRLQVINIDHHMGNPDFGQINWVEPRISSVGEMVAALALDLDLHLDQELGESLYLALVTDTGSFTYSNTGSQSLQMAAEILRQGLDLDRFNARLERQWSLSKVHVQGLAMQNAVLCFQGRVGLIKADQEVLDQAQAQPEDCEGLVNYMRQVRGVLVAVSLLQGRENIKFSLRSWGEVDVSAIAVALGGGGHRNAAGGKLALDFGQAEQRILDVLGDFLGRETA